LALKNSDKSVDDICSFSGSIIEIKIYSTLFNSIYSLSILYGFLTSEMEINFFSNNIYSN